MDGGEFRQRLAQKLRQRADARRPPRFRDVPAGPIRPGAWPALPDRTTAPESFPDAVRNDAADILSGRWRAFGHLLMYVDDPPQWFMDYVARRDVTTARSGFRANHRELPAGCDIKAVWELSRWQQLVRLGQAAWLLEDSISAGKLLEWLDHWRRQNPPYIGWNWTSALEAGIRLLNLCWIDALLDAASTDHDRAAWERTRERLLAPHVWYVSRHRSFGSSANNHLLGELAGLIAALARWPALERWASPLAELHVQWEREVLAQFASDGGNREQALNYQLFSWELCWHTRNALLAAGRTVAADVEERLRRAADFFVAIQSPTEPWDYGDSDSATAVPLFENESKAGQEWLEWMADPAGSPALRWWLGDPPAPMDPPAWQRPKPTEEWMVFPESGHAVCWTGTWQARWDLSPLGYLSTAAHGHLDALHLSLWLGGVALVIDPGTGAYYGDTRLRAWLASWRAHNGPQVPGVDFPRRMGPFLWGDHHARPTWKTVDARTLRGELAMPHGTAVREIRRLLEDGKDGWQIEDSFLSPSAAAARASGNTSGSSAAVVSGVTSFEVAWQFSPGTRFEPVADRPRTFVGRRRGMRFSVSFGEAWTGLTQVSDTPVSSRIPVVGDLVGLCSPAFREIDAGPLMIVTGRIGAPGPFRTTILRESE